MDQISVRGGTRLEGEVSVSGSKNATLALMAAALLGQGETVLRNVPRVRDVDHMLELLRGLGARADWDSEDDHRGFRDVQDPVGVLRARPRPEGRVDERGLFQVGPDRAQGRGGAGAERDADVGALAHRN